MITMSAGDDPDMIGTGFFRRREVPGQIPGDLLFPCSVKPVAEKSILQFADDRSPDAAMIIMDPLLPGGTDIFVTDIQSSGKSRFTIHDQQFSVIPQLKSPRSQQ